jgi:predicted CXXCH cytochrome family protein
MRSARKEIESQFTRRGCVGCHGVIDTHASDIFDRFQVIPIRFARDYFPSNRFPHRSHEIQKKLTGDAACLSCHAAKKSEDSSDLMIPGITKCTECHGDKAATERVTVQCVSCHEYHPREPSLLDAMGTTISTRLDSRELSHREIPGGETKGGARGELAGS